MKNNEIYMIYGTDYKSMTIDLLEAADLKDRIPDAQCRIGIKPNLVSPSEASWGATTHPEVVAGIIAYLQKYGYKNLVMLEGSWVGDRTSEAVRVCGYDRLSRETGVPFIDTQKDTAVACDCRGMELNICRSALELDFLINVPVMKGHCQTKITCALKNMKGLIPNKEKRHFHTMGLHKPIAHLNTKLHQDFIVVDNICGDWDFEDGGNPVIMNRVMAAADPVLCDAYVCDLMGYAVDEVPYVRMAEQMGVGSADLGRLNVIARNQSSMEIKTPETKKILELKDAVEEVDSCSACYGYLIPALNQLKEEGLLDKLEDKICIGQGYRDRNGILGIGNCTGKFKYCLRGCPPTETEIYKFLKAHITENRQLF